MTALVPVPPTVSRPTPPLQMIGSIFLHFPSVGLWAKLEDMANSNGKDARNRLKGLCARRSNMIFS